MVVTDNFLGCADSATVVVSEVPSTLSAFVSQSVTATCNGATDGSATVAVTGATGNIAYNWNTGSVTNSIGPVAAGTYTVTVSDDAGCIEDVTVTIAEPPALTSSILSQTVPDCDTYATATVNADGGSGPFTYTWDTSPATTGPTQDSLSAGTYQVTIVDQDNCSTTQAVTIAGPASPILLDTISITPATLCTNNDGGATVVASGTGNITYTWETFPVQNGPTASGLFPGAYRVFAVSDNGCADTLGIEIGPNCPLNIEILELSVVPNGNALSLNWEVSRTASPQAFYEIERSLDGTAFESLGTVRIPDAVGNTLIFGYDDHAVVPDQWYMYRIKSWDLNGQTGLSEIRRGIISSSQSP